MVANRATFNTSPVAEALEMVSRIDALAANGEWKRIDSLALRLKSIIPEIPRNERGSVIVTARQCLERVQSKALASRNEITEKLSEIRRGRVATKAYGQPSGPEANAALR